LFVVPPTNTPPLLLLASHIPASALHRADEEEAPLARLCLALGTQPLASLAPGELHAPGATLVFLNGSLLGIHR
jgi:hypothetical protein